MANIAGAWITDTPPVIEKAFTLHHEDGYKFVETPGKEDTIVSPTTGDDDVVMANARNLQREQHKRLHELLHVPTDGGDVSRLAASSSDANAFASRVGEGCEFGTLSDALLLRRQLKSSRPCLGLVTTSATTMLMFASWSQRLFVR